MSLLKPVLLVEDNVNDIELVQRALRRSGLPNEIHVARHGGEALDYLQRQGEFATRVAGNPLFILLDLKMPKVDGVEVLRQVKKDENLQLIPVVMLTSSNQDSDRLKCYRLGANAYVLKPVSFQEFVDTIRQMGSFWATINVPAPDASTDGGA